MNDSPPPASDDALKPSEPTLELKDAPPLNHGLLAVDSEGLITAFNRAAEELTGVTAKSALRQPLASLPPPLAEALRNALKNAAVPASHDLMLPDVASSPRSLRLTFTSLLAGEKHSPGLLVLLEALSPGLAEVDLHRQRRLASVGTLAAGMAHEVKNALVPLRIFLDLLLKKHPGVQLADVANHELRRIDSIVSQMLRFAGSARPQHAPVPLHPILDHALTLARHSRSDRNWRLRRKFNAATDVVAGDAHQLEQAFLNLLLNALEAMKSEGELTVATETLPQGCAEIPRGPALQVLIRDNGAGIAPENLARLFDPFFSTKPGGTGLGLSIARRIVQEHRGVLTVESETGQGATVRVVFPLANATKAPAPPSEPRATLSRPVPPGSNESDPCGK